MNEDIMGNVGHEAGRILGWKKEYLEVKINKVETRSKSKQR
jgi:hypothetical protein